MSSYRPNFLKVDYILDKWLLWFWMSWHWQLVYTYTIKHEVSNRIVQCIVWKWYLCTYLYSRQKNLYCIKVPLLLDEIHNPLLLFYQWLIAHLFGLQQKICIKPTLFKQKWKKSYLICIKYIVIHYSKELLKLK